MSSPIFNSVGHSTRASQYSVHQRAYLAHWLTTSGRADTTLPRTLAGARVDMNPHQVEAALFALRSPFDHGVILADEVGLGKTIEAGLVIAQRWAEYRRRILLIVPATLRKQWGQELWDKFDLPSEILEAKNFKAALAAEDNPFALESIVIVSYEFAARHPDEIQAVAWDLVVFDEAHRLRNVYRQTGNKIAKTLSEAVQSRFKLLLSATPLQNSLMELYGLVSVIDPHFFGSEDAFRAKFASQSTDEARLLELRQRVRRISQRTLRRQVQEAGLINFTNRYSITEDFRLTPEEAALYQGVSDYLRDGCEHAVSPNARHLVILVLRKILASSSFAIGATLNKMVGRLDQTLTAGISALEDYETADELSEPGEADTTPDLTRDELRALDEEIQQLKKFSTMAERIKDNAKGLALVKVLDKAFEMTEKLGGPRKAVVFTESRRTQLYLKEKLEAAGYAGQLVLMNGSNGDKESKKIYQSWIERHASSGRISGSRSADMKAAIVEEFRDRATLLIATESGAEGVNMQFCSLLINYDLPWNPQRVEQRIGRVHRYGQRYDVVVVNFLNKGNRADELVFELLDQKFRLFEGVFGASDEVLGAIESGVDVEQRIGKIYQQCRDSEQIEVAFKELRAELDESLTTAERDTRRAVLEHLDADVVSKLRTRQGAVRNQLSDYQDHLLCLARAELPDAQVFEDHLIYQGSRYDVDWQRVLSNDSRFLRTNEDLGKQLVDKAKAHPLPLASLVFDYGGLGLEFSDLRRYLNESGYLSVELLTIESADNEQHVTLAAYTQSGKELPEDTCRRLLKTPSIEQATSTAADEERLNKMLFLEADRHLRQAAKRNEQFFEEESDKLDRWAQDQRDAMDLELKKLDSEIRDAKKALRALPSLADKAKAKRSIKAMETRRDERMMVFHESRKQINEKEDELLDEVERKLDLQHSRKRLFTIQWRLVERITSPGGM